MNRLFITADEVAALLELDNASSFLRARQRLEDETGFPTPMPLPLRPLKWRREAVEAWRAAQGLAPAQRLTQDDIRRAGPNVILMAEAGRA